MGKYVILGNGVTGTRAAEMLRDADRDAEIAVVTEESDPFYRRPLLADYAAGEVGRGLLAGKKKDFYEDKGIELRLAARVREVDPDAKVVTLADGGELSYGKLLVATGRRPVGPGGDSDDRVIYMKTLEDAERIREMDGRGKRAVVHGNGLIGLEMVRAFTGAGFATTYLVPTERIWADVLDEDVADIVASRVRSAGADIVYGEDSVQVQGNGTATGVVLKSGDAVPADMVGIAASYPPSVEFLPGGVEKFAPGTDYSTPWKDVFVAGDVTADPQWGQFNWFRSWRQGADVAGVMRGTGAAESFGADLLNTQALGLSLVSIGRTVTAYRSGYKEMRGDYPYGEFYKKLVFDADDKLVGALLLGNIAEAGALTKAVREGVHKSDLDGSLLHQMFDVTYRAGYKGVQCPVCRHEIQLEAGAKVGDAVTCPVCGAQVSLEEGAQAFRARVTR